MTSKSLNTNPNNATATKKGLLFCLIFLASGIANTLIVQLIYNNVSFNSKSMLTNILIFAGYALLTFVPNKNTINSSNEQQQQQHNNNKKIKSNNDRFSTTGVSRKAFIILALFDCLASLLTTIGQIAVGSVSSKKWFSIFIIVFGLCLCVYRPSSTTSTSINNDIDESTNNENSNNSYFIFGVLSVIIASFIFSASHIYSEEKIAEFDISPFSFASLYGIYAVIVCFFYIFTITAYNRQEWILDPIADAPRENFVLVLILFSILIVTSVCRSSGIYNVLAEFGTVTMGVLYALQSTIVFFSSALFLCDPNHPVKQFQCLTSSKLLGSSIVIFGVFMYTYSQKLK
eukprot:gene6127-7633_t